MNQFPEGVKEVKELMKEMMGSELGFACMVYWPSRGKAEGIPNIIEVKHLKTSVVRKSAYYLDASGTTFYSIGSSKQEHINLRDGGAREDYWGYECKETGKDFKVIFVNDDKLFQMFADGVVNERNRRDE